MTPTAPPPLATRLLLAAIRDADWRDGVLGDLAEEFASLSRRVGPTRARAWYWRQALGIALRLSASRVVPAMAPKRPYRLPDADAEPRTRWAWLRDVRYALRALTARPALSLAVILTLALALGANATIFNLADALYLRPFRFSGVDRLVVVSSTNDTEPFSDRSSVAPADFKEWMEAVTTLTDLAAADFWDPNLSEIEQPEQLAGFRVTPGFFRLIGAEPLHGRIFFDDESTPGRDRRVVISHGLWQRRLRCGSVARRAHDSSQRRAARGGGHHAPRPLHPLRRRSLGAARVHRYRVAGAAPRLAAGAGPAGTGTDRGVRESRARRHRRAAAPGVSRDQRRPARVGRDLYARSRR
ncbi:MAG: ABC transporter permease [Vicinamibacterales bacterium]